MDVGDGLRVESLECADAYKGADGRKIAGRRVVVDVERGRTVKNWRPRRLGFSHLFHLSFRAFL